MEWAAWDAVVVEAVAQVALAVVDHRCSRTVTAVVVACEPVEVVDSDVVEEAT